MPKRQAFGLPGTPSKWRATSNQHGPGRAPVGQMEPLALGRGGGGVAATVSTVSAAAAGDKENGMDAENALAVVVMDALELEKYEKQPCEPYSPTTGEDGRTKAAAAFEESSMDADSTSGSGGSGGSGDSGDETAGRDPLTTRRKRIEQVRPHTSTPCRPVRQPPPRAGVRVSLWKLAHTPLFFQMFRSFRSQRRSAGAE